MLKKQLVMIVFALCTIASYAQVEIKGLVYDEYLEPFYNAKITLNDRTTLSDDAGEFKLNFNGVLPVTLRVTAFGYEIEEFKITSLDESINIILKESVLLDQIVISASRTPERVIESPVTIERFGLTDITKTPSSSFYDGLADLKGVQARESSYGLKSINTRGFSDLNNSRFIQMVDGMDTAAPALNFSPGNLTGVSDLDIHSVEILPGASSALYGANAYNGMMLMTTKNPFDFSGVSILLKRGSTYQKEAGNNDLYDVSVRMAYKFSESFAAKVNFSYFEAEEWHANDIRSKEIDTNEIKDIKVNDPSNLNYDGLNIYGDELNSITNLKTIAENQFRLLIAPNTVPNTFIRRTGYLEKDLLDDYNSKGLKFNVSFYYRPLSDSSLELIATSKFATGDNILQLSTRLAQRNYYVAQNKFEIKGDNFYVRSYLVSNDSGDSYDINRTGTQLTARSNTVNNNLLGVWGVDYLASLYTNNADYNNLTSEDLSRARAYADSFSLQPGTPEFNKQLNIVKSTLITEGGSRIYDKSSYFHTEGNYNFTSLLNDWADIQVGGSFRQYNPKSKGTVFNDGSKEIEVKEYGFYSQIQKKFLENRLKVTGSVRYDKSQNFNGNYSPRLAINYALGEEKNHFLRASYQTGFRNPTIQEQYIFNGIGNLLFPGRKINIGTSKDNLDRVSFGSQNDILNSANKQTDIVISGNEVINNSLLTETVFGDTGYVGDPLKSRYKAITPEEVQTLELGYRSMFGITATNNVNIDVSGFYSKHKDFVFTQNIVTPRYGIVYPNGNVSVTDAEKAANALALYSDGGRGNVIVYDADANDAIDLGHFQEFTIYTNSKSKVNSYGFGIGLNTKLLKYFDFGFNYNFTDFEIEDKDLGFFEPNFNTPKHTVKVQLGNNSVFKNFGFNISSRWQDKYRWVSRFVKGNIGSRTVLDAQLNYRIPSMKSKFKIGGTNLFGKEYYVAPGTGQIGQLYYISWIIN